MNSLVADYGTSSSEIESDKSDVEETTSEENKNETLAKLPKPDFDGSSSKKSVFSNPFAEAENAKKAILEKHVKMVQVPTKDKVDMINGKKICWNYRKGRCHFGHNCTFAHDTDLQRSKDDTEDIQISSPISENSNIQGKSGVSQSSTNQPDIDESAADNSQDKWELQANRKKRPGLSSTLVPSKKAMKFYKKTKDSK